MSLIRGVFIVAAKRTAFGKFGGKLKGKSATQLAIIASKAAIEAGDVHAEHIDNVVMGNVIQVSTYENFHTVFLLCTGSIAIPTSYSLRVMLCIWLDMSDSIQELLSLPLLLLSTDCVGLDSSLLLLEQR